MKLDEKIFFLKYIKNRLRLEESLEELSQILKINKKYEVIIEEKKLYDYLLFRLRPEEIFNNGKYFNHRVAHNLIPQRWKIILDN